MTPMVDGLASGLPRAFLDACRIVGTGSMPERPPSPSVARQRVALKDASRRFAMAKRPSLTANRHLAPGTAGRDGGMVFSIKHRDRRKGEHQTAFCVNDEVSVPWAV